MKCFFCKNSLSDHVEGILDGELEEKIKKHLAECNDCSDYYAELKYGRKILEQISLLDPGSDFYENVTKQIVGNTWYGRGYRKIFLPLKIKGPLFFLIVTTFGLVTSFMFIEYSKNSFFSHVEFNLFQPKTRENNILNVQKEKIKNFANELDTKFTKDKKNEPSETTMVNTEKKENKITPLTQVREIVPVDQTVSSSNSVQQQNVPLKENLTNINESEDSAKLLQENNFH